MASFGSGFSSGLGQGMAMGKMLMDTYNENKMKRDLEEAASLDQQSVDGALSDSQIAEITRIRGLKNDAGESSYVVEDLGNGGIRYKGIGQEGGDWGTIAPSKTYKLGNQTSETGFRSDQIERARANAIADVYAKNGDPMRGLQYRQAAREDRYASNEEKVLDFMRNSSNMSDDEFYSGLSKMATGHGNDGLAFGYTKGPNGEPLIGMVGQDGKLVLQPATRDLAVSKLLQYISPSNYRQERAYGLEERKLNETRDYHQGMIGVHRESNQISRERNGLLAASRESRDPYDLIDKKATAYAKALMNADPNMTPEAANKKAWQSIMRDFDKSQPGQLLGTTDDGKSLVYSSGDEIITKPLPAGVSANNLFRKATGEGGGSGVRMEYTDDAGNKISGSPQEVHNTRMSIDPKYRAAYGGAGGSGLAMTPPASNKTGSGLASPGKQPPAAGGSQEFEVMLNDAKRGGTTGRNYLRQQIESNELSMLQRKRAEEILNQR